MNETFVLHATVLTLLFKEQQVKVTCSLLLWSNQKWHTMQQIEQHSLRYMVGHVFSKTGVRNDSETVKKNCIMHKVRNDSMTLPLQFCIQSKCLVFFVSQFFLSSFCFLLNRVQFLGQTFSFLNVSPLLVGIFQRLRMSLFHILVTFLGW